MSVLIDTDEASDLPTPREPSRPQPGDVVVTRELHATVHYTLRQFPGVAQFSAAVRDEAVRLARTFGQGHRIDVWYDDNGSFRLLEAYRPRTSPTASMPQGLGVVPAAATTHVGQRRKQFP